MIFKLFIIIYIILVIYKTIELQKYNENGYLINIKDNNEFLESLKKLNPLIYNIDNNIDYEFLINKKPSYFISHGDDIFPLKGFKEEKFFNVYKNKKIIDSFSLKQDLFNLNILKDNKYLFPKFYSLSLLKGNISIPLEKCKHNYNIIGNLEGESIIFLFNPKHKEDITNKKIMK